MKKALVYSLYYYPNFVGGAEVAIKEITDRLDGGEYGFDLICLKGDHTESDFEKIGNVNVYRFGLVSDIKWIQKILTKFNKYTFPIFGLIKGMSLYRKRHYDFMWSVIASYNSFAAVLLKRIYPGLSFLLTLQEGDSPEYIKRRARIAWPFFKDIFWKADHVQVISNFLADFARDMGYRGDISVVPNGVDFEFFSTKVDERVDSIQKKHDKKDGDIWIFTSSRMVVKNNLGIVIETISNLPTNYKFLIAGRGDMEEKLKIQAKDLSVADRVVFLGYLDKDYLPEYQFASDIFIRPSLSEGFGNSFIEAMASKLPVIATARGGIVDFIHDKQNGLFVDPESVDSIVKAIKTLDEDSDLREKIVKNAYQMVKEDYDWSKISLEIKEVFEKTLKS